MSTQIEVTGFDPGWTASPWYEWTDSQSAVAWALQAMKVNTLDLRQHGVDDSVSWDDFARHLDVTFRGPDWRRNAIIQRLLHAGAEVEQAWPMRMGDERWVYAGSMARTALETWHSDTTDLVGLAARIGVDPVQVGWVAAVQAVEQPDFGRDFASYVRYYLSEGGSLPDAATISSWFGRDLLPEAIVARFQTDFPDGVTTKAGVLTIDDIGPFYLGKEVWAATNLLSDDSVDPDFVQEILDYFTSDEPLSETQKSRVKEAIDKGYITFEDVD